MFKKIAGNAFKMIPSKVPAHPRPRVLVWKRYNHLESVAAKKFKVTWKITIFPKISSRSVY